MIAAEDCGAQSLLKCQTLELEETGNEDKAWKREHGGEDEDEEDDKIQEPKLSEYERTKAKNIAKLKAILAALDEQKPMPKEHQPKKAAKASKKDQQRKEITVRCVSQRNKDNR